MTFEAVETWLSENLSALIEKYDMPGAAVAVLAGGQVLDQVAASEGLVVHPNTFRYRLRRLTEVGDLDLGDPDVRLGLMLQLRVLPPVP